MAENDGPANGIKKADLAPDPIVQFKRWYEEALGSGLENPDAMTLATASADGRPSARIVLLKTVDEGGFVFFTNYKSRKARELAENPWASLVFLWDPLGRQVRIEGPVEKTTAAESDDYHHSRPRGSQLGALVSRQSEVITNRNALDARLEKLTGRYEAKEIPRPDFWGGYRLRPTTIEFWQHRDNRLHDRLRYGRRETGEWVLERLAP